MFKKTIVIMLSGRAGTGKSTSANYLNELAKQDGLESTVASFSTPLKNIAMSMGWDGKKDERGRKLLQRLGSEVGREYDEDMWCKLLFGWLEGGRVYDVIFIDDWRFVSEYKFVKNRFPYIPISVRIEAPDREILKGTEDYNHISEISLPEDHPNFYDFSVLNKDDETNLKENLNRIWKSINTDLEYYYKRGEK